MKGLFKRKKMENQKIEYKSLKKIIDSAGKIKTEGIKELAIACVAFANQSNGKLYIGVEDENFLPPANQKIPKNLPNDVITRLRSQCFNVGLHLHPIENHDNGGEFFIIEVLYSASTIATTSNGKIYIRLGDKNEPIRSEDIVRLTAEKNGFQWELQPKNITVEQISPEKIHAFAQDIRQSDRVKESVKNKTDIEIIEHYNLIYEGKLTNLGVLWLGNAQQRARLVYPITVQYIVYNEQDEKVRKEEWNDYQFNPKELLSDIEKTATELTYSYEISDGLFRRNIRKYPAKVIRELLVNAFVHKTFTIAGDIFIKLYSNRLEVINPGGLPLGVTPETILHQSVSRNPHLKRVFHDLKLMEGEGTGYDLLYEQASKDSKPFPKVYSDFNKCIVEQSSEIIDEELLPLLDFINNQYVLTQKESIVMGIVAHHKKILSTELSKLLQLSEEERLRSYVNNLLKKNLLISRGIKKSTEYIINPKLIQNAKINIKPTLKFIEPHTLRTLILEDIKMYPNTKIAEIHKRLGDVDIRDIRKVIYKLVENKVLNTSGGKTNRTYSISK